MEYEETLGEGAEFTSRRIDELLASAIEDQARDQRLMIETVTAARKVMGGAQADLHALRTMIESRDQDVIDLLEARMSGVANQESVDDIARRIRPVEAVAQELLDRLQSLGQPLDGIAAAVALLNESVEVLKSQSRTDLQRIVAGTEDLERKFADALETHEQVIAGKMAMSQNSLAERLEDKQDRFSTKQTEMLEAAITELRTGTEEILRSSDATIKQDLRQELQNFGARTFDRLQKLRDDVSAYEKTLQDLPMLVDEHLTAHKESAQAANAAFSRQLEQVRKSVAEMEVTLATRFEKIDKDISSRFEAFIDNISATTQTLSDAVHSLLSDQGSLIGETVETVLSPFVDEVKSLGDRVKQTNRRISESNSRMEAMHESLIAYLAKKDEEAEKTRDAVLVDLIEQMATQLGRKDRIRISDALKDADARRKDKRDAERYRKLVKKQKVETSIDLDAVAAEVASAAILEEPLSLEIDLVEADQPAKMSTSSAEVRKVKKSPTQEKKTKKKSSGTRQKGSK